MNIISSCSEPSYEIALMDPSKGLRRIISIAATFNLISNFCLIAQFYGLSWGDDGGRHQDPISHSFDRIEAKPGSQPPFDWFLDFVNEQKWRKDFVIDF